ncbi:MAG: translation initiation factor IF-2 [Parcubacteria group bacterium]|nr:translation initiation factor IF-2 [Parcubacteria group bacterium]
MKQKINLENNLIARPPIVVVMGHIDHGKTTLLDYIKKTKVAEKESGGITQHIGAYEIIFNGRKITFIDTPGHEAFSRMRERGAKVADIALLVVAADEGIKPQTLEALSHIQKSELPFMVVINKSDKPGANPEKIKQDLANQGVMVESWGGKVPSVEVSAKTGQNIDHLLELILLVADLEELKGNSDVGASGFVIESHVDPKRGRIATLIVTDGILRVGDWMVIGPDTSKVRSFEDFLGRGVKEATFSAPILIFGFSSSPVLGEQFFAFKDKKSAEEKASHFSKKETGIVRLLKEDGETAILKIVLKADVSGSIEALEEIIKKLSFKEGKALIVRSGTGDVNIDDTNFAKSAPNTIVVAFRVKVPSLVKEILDQEGVGVVFSDIIYEIEEAIKQKLFSIIPSNIEIVPLGKIKILAIFKSEKNKMIIGGRVLSGKIKKGAVASVFRNNREVGQGRVLGLKQVNKDVEEVGQGLESGILFETEIKIIPDDILEISEEVKKERVLTPHD